MRSRQASPCHGRPRSRGFRLPLDSASSYPSLGSDHLEGAEIPGEGGSPPRPGDDDVGDAELVEAADCVPESLRRSGDPGDPHPDEEEAPQGRGIAARLGAGGVDALQLGGEAGQGACDAERAAVRLARALGHPGGAEARREAHAPGASRRDGERQAGALQAAGVHVGAERLVEAAVMGRDRLGEQLIEEGHELLEAISALAAAPGLAACGGGVEATPTRPDSEGEPATGDVVERHQFSGEGHWVAEVGRRDQGAEADPRGDGGGRRQRGHSPEPGRIPE